MTPLEGFADSPRAFFTRIASSAHPSLSYSEEFLWWSARLAGDATFNVRVVLRLTGPLRLDALEAAIAEVARRHETLRTVFPMENGVIRRRLLPPGSTRPAVEDLAHVETAHRDTEAWRLVLDEANRPFNLTRGPLFRSAILRLGQDDHLLQFTIHHLVIDGRSVDILLRELGILYDAYCRNRESPLPELAVQYGDYAARRRRLLQGCALERALSYWTAQLAAIPSLLDLPTDGPRRTARHYPGHTIMFALSADHTRGLGRLARQHGTTMFVVLLGILDILLYRLSGTSSIVVETPLGNRRSLEAEGLIGLLVDLVVLRTDLDTNTRLPDLLASVRRATLGAFDHAGVPIHVLVSALDAGLDASHSALSQVMFNLIDMRPRALQMCALETRQLALPDSPHSKFDLMLTAHLRDTLQFQLLYRRDLFSELRMQELVEQFRTLVDQVLAAPDTRVGVYSLVTARARSVLPGLTARPAAGSVCTLHARVRSHAAACPEQDALVDGRRAVSYRELDRSLDDLDGILEAFGVSQGACSHQDLADYARWTTGTFSIPPGVHVGVLPGARAKVLPQALFTALWSGGTLCLAPPCEESPNALHTWLGKGIAVAFGEPTAWRRLNVQGRTLPSLRYAFFVGDALVREDVARIRTLAPEATCAYFFAPGSLPHSCSCYRIPPDTTELRAIVPAGRGISNVELVILNRNNQLAGIGELGELYVRGVRSQASSGRNDDGLIATGVMGRFLPDGTVDALGDSSKYGSIDGYTVRFDEITSVLMRHPDIRDATVHLGTNGANSELVAYITTDDDLAWPCKDLDRFAREHLPAYSVPRRFVRQTVCDAGVI